MKNAKLVFGVVIVVVLCLILVNVYFLNPPPSEKLKKPQAKIEIQKVIGGELTVNQGKSIFFSAENSSDKDGKIDNYHWDFDDGNTSDSVTPVHEYDDPGTYYVTLTVEDNDGNTNITSIKITVINTPPFARCNIINHPSTSTGKIPIFHTIQFTGIDSYDDDGEIVNYYWDFGDGNSSSEKNPIYQYDIIGNFNVTLKVTDNDGDLAYDYLDIKIILRKYKIEWNLEQTEKVLESNGYTLEGQSTEINETVDQEFLSSVKVILNWTDRQPLLKNNQTKGEDLFELDILTPENLIKIENSTSGNISITITYLSSVKDMELEAKTANEAITLAIYDMGFSDLGMGLWFFNISALECKGGNWINEDFDLDIGNFWDLKIINSYYTYEITEIGIE